MIERTKIEKVLVVLSPDLIRPDQPSESALMQRAVALAKTSGCEIELFHVCYEGALEYQLFASTADLARERERLIEHDTTQLAEIATRLRNEGVEVRYEVRWDAPRTDAILRKIAQARPDVVMKQSREHSYVLGVTTNTDWDLARRSPSNVWLVSAETGRIDHVMAAVGSQLVHAHDITTAEDYDLFRAARLVADEFGADVYPVNAYQVPNTEGMLGAAGGTAIPAETAVDLQTTRAQVIKQHSAAIDAFAQYFGIPTNNVHLCEGHPNDVIPEVAEAIDADLLVMGAGTIGRLERLISPVTVEPVLAETRCDILIVRERDLSVVPDVERQPDVGEPKLSLERAISHPDETFDSPQQLASLSEISFDLRSRILQAWEYDIRAGMNEENEGGPANDIDVNALDDIRSARALLEMNKKKAGNRQTTLGGARA